MHQLLCRPRFVLLCFLFWVEEKNQFCFCSMFAVGFAGFWPVQFVKYQFLVEEILIKINPYFRMFGADMSCSSIRLVHYVTSPFVRSCIRLSVCDNHVDIYIPDILETFWSILMRSYAHTKLDKAQQFWWVSYICDVLIKQWQYDDTFQCLLSK